MMRHTPLLLVLAFLVAVQAYGFGPSEEKFIKKYAMMKVYESCFGLQVLKEVRKEMKEAAHKCSGFNNDFNDKYVNYEPTELIKEHFTTERPRPSRPSTERTTRKPIHSADTLLIQQWAENNQIDEDLPQGEPVDETETESEPETTQAPTRKPLDLSKLEEAILNINRPGNHIGFGQRPAYSPGSSPNYQAPHGGYYPPMFYPPPMPYPQSYYPYYPYYQPQAPAAPAPAAPYTPYYSRSGYRSAKITKGFDGSKAPETESTLVQVSSSGTRSRKSKVLEDKNLESTTASSRKDRAVSDFPGRGRTLVPPKELDVKASMDAMTMHSGAGMRNITCVMQELGYLDDKLEPNYERMIERIEKLPAPPELKKDMVDGVQFCKQFSQCVPDIRKDKYQLSKEFLRPMFFFRCYKHKKLESCIMKDVRDRFVTSSATAFEDSSAMANELRRSFSSKNDLASSVFEFMYGSGADDFDAIM